MIIFELDDVLADTSHRQHFIKEPAMWIPNPDFKENHMVSAITINPEWKIWQPDYDAYNAACVDDKPIVPVIEQWNIQISLGMMDVHQIWTLRSEKYREITEKWLHKNLLCFNSNQLKMRPVGDDTPIDQLKEKWYDYYINSLDSLSNTIDFVFCSNKDEIAMWRRRGVFVFDCNQGNL